MKKMILFLNTGREALQRAACASNIEDNHCSGLSGDDDGDDDGYQVSFSTSQISRGFLWQKNKTVLSLKTRYICHISIDIAPN